MNEPMTIHTGTASAVAKKLKEMGEPSVSETLEERAGEARCAAANGSTLSGALRKLADSLDQLDKMFESTPKPGGPAQTLREAATQLDEADAYIGALEDVCDSDQLARAQSLSNQLDVGRDESADTKPNNQPK